MFKGRWIYAGLSFLILVLILLVAYFGTSFVSSISGEFYLNNPLFHLLFTFILILILVLFVFFVRNLVLFLFPHFKTNLRTKIFTAFLLLILGPSLFAIFVSSSVVNKGLDRLLRIQVKRIVSLSSETVVDFESFIASDLKRKIHQLRWKKRVYSYTLKVYGIDGFLRKINGKIEKVGEVPLEVLNLKFPKNLKEFSYLDLKRGLFVVCEAKKFTVCVSKRFPEKLLEDIKKVRTLYGNYESLVAYSSPIKAIYTLAFALIGIGVIFGALWFARYFEKRITIPIEALYRATQKISKGELDVKVEEEGVDELKHVIEAFNYMVEQLKALRTSLEESKVYLEQILNSISPAIITFDLKGKIKSCNQSAKKLLGLNETLRGQDLLEVLGRYPNLKKAVEKLLLKGNEKVEVREIVSGKEKFFSIEVLLLEGFEKILIIEDVTDIVKAQKSQAWKEIAQRIAHEIKNPLTPITLNAERLLRQYEKGNPDFHSVLKKCVSSILSEVEVIERLIDEFRKFARLPLPEKKLTDLNSLIREFSENYEGTSLKIELNLEDIPKVSLDRVLFREVLVNLLKNSLEAGATKVTINTTEKDGKVYVVVRDNGPGIPEELMDKVFLPYVSGKEKGWGLGLSVVKKIVEDHGGRIFLVDRNTFVIELPV